MPITKQMQVPGFLAAQALGTGTGRQIKAVYIEGITAASTETYNLNAVVPCKVVLGRGFETINDSLAYTGSTISNTSTGPVITFAGHTGAGGYKGLWYVE